MKEKIDKKMFVGQPKTKPTWLVSVGAFYVLLSNPLILQTEYHIKKKKRKKKEVLY